MDGNKPKVRVHLYLTAETWDRLVLHIREVYGTDARITSATIEKAVKEYLDREAPVPAKK